MPSAQPSRAALLTGTAVASIAAAALAAAPAAAQGAVEEATEVIIITATKRAGGVDVQDAPIAIAVTAYGAEQLDARFVRKLDDLSYSMPNVQLNDIGTARGIANFSIRGLGINSSIPSIDPTVGVFVDGMYLGLNGGVVLDMFDLDGIEVLRGPQGLLFGRNVTGGAVLVRTKAPSLDGFEVDAKAALEEGLNYYAMGGVSGPVTDRLAARLSVYYNQDEGWFENLANGNDDFGEAETVMVRPSVLWEPVDTFDTILRYEHFESDGDGPAAQNHAIFDRDSFDFAIDNEGSYDTTWDRATWEANWRIPLGDGTITNIFGWRDYEALTDGDIDSLPVPIFHANTSTEQEQWSNELRYSGTFEDALDVTAGVYYFTQDLEYRERRVLSPIISPLPDITGGGFQDQTTWGLFGQVDMHLTEALTLNVGMRYTSEEKEAGVVPLPADGCVVSGPCDFNVTFPVPGVGLVPVGFLDEADWQDTTAKLGVQYRPTDDLNLYAFYTTGFRSGGYNLRNGSLFLPPGPFDPEDVASYEAGAKWDGAGGLFRINGAVFYNEIKDMQREINLPDPALGVQQFIRNTADATIQGFELEGQLQPTDTLLLTAQAGYTDGDYDEILFDLTGDGVINQADFDLEIPRLAPWTYGLGGIYDLPLGDLGMLTSRLSWNHRDRAYYTDDNRGFFNAIDYVDASFGFTPGAYDTVTVSLYGKNLLDEAQFGGDTRLPEAVLPPGAVPGFPFAGPFGGPGASFSPLEKGRVIGVEAQVRY